MVRCSYINSISVLFCSPKQLQVLQHKMYLLTVLLLHLYIWAGGHQKMIRKMGSSWDMSFVLLLLMEEQLSIWILQWLVQRWHHCILTLYTIVPLLLKRVLEEDHSAVLSLWELMKQVAKPYIEGVLLIYHPLPCFISAPSAPPQNVTGTGLDSQTITMSWSPPPSSDTNGVIREYRVNVTEVETGMTLNLTTATTSITLQSLHPYYNYRCIVSAYTVGVGPYTEVFNIRTPEDGML